jgi:amino acid transporter
MIQPTALNRSLSLTQMVLYGIGTTVGAGIYALVGEIAAVAGYLAPWSFLLAAGMAGFTAFSFARLSARYPSAAGAALYVQHGFDSSRTGQVVGFGVILAGVISSAALLNGFVGYLQEFVAPGPAITIVLASVALCAIAAWGVAESVWIAGIISVVEVLGLVWVTVLAGQAADFSAPRLHQLLPDLSLSTWSFVFSGAVLAFYAYIGFEDMVEVAEEVRDVSTTLPRAIFLTLGVSTFIYIMLVTTTIIATGPELLAASPAPMAAVYRELTGGDPIVISFIGLFAIINGALIQIIMASRVLYGLSSRGQLPHVFATVHPRTKTPLVATVTAATAVMLLALAGSLASLAELTSVTMLSVFALVNWSLYRLLRQQSPIHAAIGLIGGFICAGFALRTVSLWFF